MARFKYGLPATMSYYFTYYINDTGWIEQRAPYNTRKFNENLGKLFRSASNAAQKGMASLNTIESIQNATRFIATVAANERAKELAAVKKFCKKYENEFPALNNLLKNPEAILDDPKQFYNELIMAINKMRRGSTQFLEELQELKRRIAAAREENRNLANYNQEDYRYRVGNVETFVRRLVGNYNLTKDIAAAQSDSAKVGQIVMNIINQLDIPSKLASGEDFVAIASAVYLDVERRFQHEYQANKRFLGYDPEERMSHVIDEMGAEIEKTYLKELSSQQTKTKVQDALNNINSATTQRLFNNIKTVLGITTLSDDEAVSQLSRIAKNQKNNSQRTAPIRSLVANMTSKVKQNQTLSKSIKNVQMSISGSAYTKHGTLYEAIEGLFTSGHAAKVEGSAAVDLLTLEMEARYDDTSIETMTTNLIDAISTELSYVAAEIAYPDNKDASRRDLTSALDQMNSTINKAIAIL